MYLRLNGNLIYSWGQSGNQEYFGAAELDYKSPKALLVEWDGLYGRMYEEAVLDGVDDVVRQMSQRLLVRIKPGPQILEVDRKQIHQ